MSSSGDRVTGQNSSLETLNKLQRDLIEKIKMEHRRTVTYHDQEIAAHEKAIKRHMDSIDRHRVQQENCASTVKRCEEVVKLGKVVNGTNEGSLDQYLNR